MGPFDNLSDLGSIPNTDRYLDDYWSPNPELHYRHHQQVNDTLLPDHSATWVNNTLVPEPTLQPVLGPGSHPATHVYSDTAGFADTWMDTDFPPVAVMQQPQVLTTVKEDTEEISGIKLVYALLMCAEAIQLGAIQLAALLVEQMTIVLMPRVNNYYGIGKVAAYFIEALNRKICNPFLMSGPARSDMENEILYNHFYEACPYLKFAHFTANQAILQAFEGHDLVHVMDFSPSHGLQWPSLIQALALRPGGPPFLRITAIGPQTLVAVGSKLAQLAQQLNVGFAYQVVTATNLEGTKLPTLERNPGEAIAVNSVQEFHKLIGSNISSILKWVRRLNPKIVTIVEQEANHNQVEFLPRFAEALFYYSAMFDSLEACQVYLDKALAELYLQREISNIVCCEGVARVERHEPLARWRARMNRAGFMQLHMGQHAVAQANLLLRMFSFGEYSVGESKGCLKLKWHGRSVITSSAWQVEDQAESSTGVTHDGSSSSSSSCYN